MWGFEQGKKKSKKGSGGRNVHSKPEIPVSSVPAKVKVVVFERANPPLAIPMPFPSTAEMIEVSGGVLAYTCEVRNNPARKLINGYMTNEMRD